MKENEEELDQGTFLGRHADALEGVDLSWRPDDEISINGHLYVTETGGKEALFIPDDKEVPSSLSYFATYPADLSVAWSGDSRSGGGMYESV